MSNVLERFTTAAIGIAALAVAAVVVKREFTPPPASASTLPKPSFKEDWEAFRQAGISIEGDSSAEVLIMEFADFQCPICAAFDPIVDSVTARYGRRVSRRFVHFPLPGHKFARAAAQAAECAHDQGRFRAMKTALYAKQDSFGLRSWASFARDAGVKDMNRFQSCYDSALNSRRIDSGFALAERLGFRGTPVTLVNGWAVMGIMRDSTLAGTIDAAIKGKKPPGAQ